MHNNPNEHSSLGLELRCILRDVLKNFWIPLALSISVACLAFVGGKLLYHPTYTTSTTFMVSRTGSVSSAASNLQSAREIVPVFQSLVSSSLMQKRVCADMGLDALPGTIAVAAVPETNLVTISATASRPDTAFQILKSLLRVYPEVGEKSLGKLILEVFDHPTFPDRPDRPFAGSRILGLAFAITLLCSSAAMGTMSFLNDTVKTPDQAKAKLDTRLLGVIYHEKPYRSLHDRLHRKRKTMRMTDPTVSFLFEENMKKLGTKLLYKLRSSHAQVVLITSTLPGEGKSVLAMNLAQDLSHRGKNVLLIEGDLQNPGLADVLHLHKKDLPDWGLLLSRGQDPAEAMVRLNHYGFAALLNNVPLPQAADLLAVSDLPRWLDAWKKQYDVILVDAPPVRRRSDAELWARCADLSLLVVRQNTAEAKYINDSIDMLEAYGSGLLGCVYNDAIKVRDFSTSGGYGYNYSRYGSYSHYGHYGSYEKYGNYQKSRQADPIPSTEEPELEDL